MECRSVLFRSQNLGETERAAVERVRAIVDRGLPGLAVEFETAAGKPVGEAAHGRSEILRLVDIIGEIVVPERDIGLLALAMGMTTDCRVAPRAMIVPEMPLPLVSGTPGTLRPSGNLPQVDCDASAPSAGVGRKSGVWGKG